MLPFDCLNHVANYCKDHQSMLSLFSTNSFYYEFRKKVRWKKEPVYVGDRALNLPFYDNIEYIYLSKLSCVYSPKHLRKITYFPNDYKKYKITPFDVEGFASNKFESEIKVEIQGGYYINVTNELFQHSAVTKVKIEGMLYGGLKWPKQLHTLSIRGGHGWIIANRHLPTHVKKLKFKECAEFVNPDALLDLHCLEHLELHYKSKKSELEDDIIPKNVKTLVLSNVLLYNDCMPEGIEKIIHKGYVRVDCLVGSFFPNSTTYLYLEKGCRHKILYKYEFFFPPNLEYLYIGDTEPEDIDFSNLPKTLKEMHLTHNDKTYHYNFPF